MQVKSYFGKRMEEHGASPRGVDWNSDESQNTRFDQLLKIVETPSFSILDYGCGYGALADYMEQKGFHAEYYGFDILESAIEIARQTHEQANRTVRSSRIRIHCPFAIMWLPAACSMCAADNLLKHGRSM